MNITDPLERERAQHFHAKSYPESERDLSLSRDDDGFRRTELFSDYPPGPSQSLTPVMMQNAKENPGLSTARESEIAEIPSESNHRISDLLTLRSAEPTTAQIRMGDDQSLRSETDTESEALFSDCPQDPTSQETPGFTEEEEMEPDFLLDVKMEVEEEEEEEPLEKVIRNTGRKSKKKKALALETPELEEMIDMSSFTDGIYICEVSQAAQMSNIFSHFP